MVQTGCQLACSRSSNAGFIFRITSQKCFCLAFRRDHNGFGKAATKPDEAMVLRVILEVPEPTLEEIERLREENRHAVNPVQRKRSDTLEGFILHLIGMGIGEW
jgi:hypothetical protein